MTEDIQPAQERDPLTGLLTMASFQNYSRRAMGLDTVRDQNPAIVYFNIHNFSRFNDKFGYEEGDRFLRNFARIIQNVFQDQLAARFDSDHFYVGTYRDGLEERIHEVQEGLEKIRYSLPMRLQTGIYVLNGDTYISRACDRAKIAANAVTSENPEGYRFYDEELNRELERSRYIVEHIDEAIEKKWIKVYFQPVVRSLTGELCSVEALARWEDPIYHLMPPGVFISVLEQAGQIHKVDSYVIRECCRLLHDLREEGRDVVPFSFNLSRLDFRLCDIYKVIDDAVEQYEIPREYVKVEITESMLLGDPALISNRILKFHENGYKVWMDDFGSGYSSLNLLKNFDFDELKIDMAFLRDFTDRSRKIITSIVDMAKKLGIQTLAEGVETKEQYEFLQAIGCEKIQGYYFGKPEPYPDYLESLRQKHVSPEPPKLRTYYDAVGQVNLLDGSVFRDGSLVRLEENATPLALIEYDGSAYHYRYANEAYRRTLDKVGTHGLEAATAILNAKDLALAKLFVGFTRNIVEKGGVQQLNYVDHDQYCTMKAALIAKRGKRYMLAATIFNLSEHSDLVYQSEVMDTTLRVLLTMYDDVYLEDLAHDQTRRMFISERGADQESMREQTMARRESQLHYERECIYPDDQKRYRAFTDDSTLIQRIQATGKDFISDYFRTRDQDGKYVWKTFITLAVPGTDDHQVLTCIRLAMPDDAAFDRVLEQMKMPKGSEDSGENRESEVLPASTAETAQQDTLTEAQLWHNLVMNTSLVGFWKDRHRRFLGVTRAFLDYYNIEEKDVIGKTDEEMGWHVHQDPYRDDEIRVLTLGEHIHDVPGKCIVQGEPHDIAASKIPIYHGGQIAGLMGYMVDLNGVGQLKETAIYQMDHDPLTGLLNIHGMMSGIMSWQDSFEKEGTDYVMIYMSISGFGRMRQIYGTDLTDQVLRLVADELRNTLGNTALLSRLKSDEFIALLQRERTEGEADGDSQVDLLLKKLYHHAHSIREVDGQSVTIFLRTGYAFASECSSTEEMLQMARKNSLR